MFSCPSLECLFLVTILAGGECARYLGCYREGPNEKKLMNGDQQDFNDVVTPQICIDFCKNKEYEYAGLQFGFKCFCSSKRPPYTALANHQEECNFPCIGDNEKTCGGKWRISIYDIKEKKRNQVLDKYDGCYDARKGEDVLTAEATNLAGIMTPELCVGHCFRHGYHFAGLHDGMECQCGNEKHGEKVLADECEEGCSGLRELKCGGASATAVYHTNLIDGLRGVEATYEGCFKEEESLKEEQLVSDSLTPALCVRHCSQKGYLYAALQYGRECWCGDKKKGGKVSDEQCDVDCSGEGKLICGGRQRVSVYRNQGADEGILLGCFIEEESDRLFPTEFAEFRRNNSLKTCLNHCKTSGFRFAGLEKGARKTRNSGENSTSNFGPIMYGCYCDNERPHAKTTNETECSTKCPGDDSQQCGGQARLGVYTTGIQLH